MARDANRLADPGAQLERTSLAWTRTAVSIAACGALLVRTGFVDHFVPALAGGAVVLLAAGAVFLLASLRYHATKGRPGLHLLVGHPYAVRGLTVLVTLASGLAAAVCLATALA
ncbi:MAG: DUF202 domain-containing protein [Acidothermales bacterium]|nr:DUF202 domain-containing protein [Acidothermales bacterium]